MWHSCFFISFLIAYCPDNNNNNNNNNINNSTFILKERGFTKSYVAKYRLFTPHQ